MTLRITDIADDFEAMADRALMFAETHGRGDAASLFLAHLHGHLISPARHDRNASRIVQSIERLLPHLSRAGAPDDKGTP